MRRRALLGTLCVFTGTAAVLAPPTPAHALPCAAPVPAEPTGRVRTELRQLSGLARLPGAPEVLWAHNDRGLRDVPAPGEDVTHAQVWALRSDGTLLAHYTLAGADGALLPYVDTEAIAAGPGGTLVLADTGTNADPRTTVHLLRFTPPPVDPDQAFVEGVITGVEVVPVEYANRASSSTLLTLNVEAIVVDGDGDTWFLPRKGRTTVTAYRATAADLAVAAETGVPARATAALTLSLGKTITDASRSPDGAWLVVKSLKTTWAWPLAGRSVGEALASTPCVAAHATGKGKPGYGEAVSVLDDGSFVTVKEAGKDPALAPSAPIWSFGG